MRTSNPLCSASSMSVRSAGSLNRSNQGTSASDAASAGAVAP
jgi:hypothetical protein